MLRKKKTCVLGQSFEDSHEWWGLFCLFMFIFASLSIFTFYIKRSLESSVNLRLLTIVLVELFSVCMNMYSKKSIRAKKSEKTRNLGISSAPLLFRKRNDKERWRDFTKVTPSWTLAQLNLWSPTLIVVTDCLYVFLICSYPFLWFFSLQSWRENLIRLIAISPHKFLFYTTDQYKIEVTSEGLRNTGPSWVCPLQLCEITQEHAL